MAIQTMASTWVPGLKHGNGGGIFLGSVSTNLDTRDEPSEIRKNISPKHWFPPDYQRLTLNMVAVIVSLMN
jgi:hypothetical protein